jgi:hypothetical protein
MEPKEAPRTGYASDAEIVLPGRGLQYGGRITNLSAQGCLIETKCRLEPGTSVEVWMRTEGIPLRVAASLVDRREQGVEVRFNGVSGRKLGQIEALVLEIAEEARRVAASRTGIAAAPRAVISLRG